MIGGNDWKLTQIDIGGEIVPEAKARLLFLPRPGRFRPDIVAAWRADNNDLVRRMANCGTILTIQEPGSASTVVKTKSAATAAPI